MAAASPLDAGQLPGSLVKSHAGPPIPFVRANALAPFVGLLNEIGAPVERLLRQARVPPSLLIDPEGLISLFSSYRFIELAAREEQMRELGSIVAQRASALDLGDYGAALRGASTVYDYLKIGIRLIGRHSSGTRFWLTKEHGWIRVNQYLSGPSGLGRCIADVFTLAITVNTLRGFLGPTWSPGEVRLLTGDESLIGDRGIFGDAPLVTGQCHTSFTISCPLLQFTVPARGAGTVSSNDIRTFAADPMPADLITSTKQLIVSLLVDGYPGIQSVADAAGMSPRTLQRRLTEAGATYSDLVAASRLQLAKVWLVDSDIPIAEIAATLGYNEPSNFARAFRRQTGISPAAYRRGAAQPPPAIPLP